MSNQLATWINPAIDTGERFAEEIVSVESETKDIELVSGIPIGMNTHSEIIVDGEVFLRVIDNEQLAETRAVDLRKVIAASYDAGREQGRKESR